MTDSAISKAHLAAEIAQLELRMQDKFDKKIDSIYCEIRSCSEDTQSTNTMIREHIIKAPTREEVSIIAENVKSIMTVVEPIKAAKAQLWTMFVSNVMFVIFGLVGGVGVQQIYLKLTGG